MPSRQDIKKTRGWALTVLEDDVPAGALVLEVRNEDVIAARPRGRGAFSIYSRAASCVMCGQRMRARVYKHAIQEDRLIFQ
jgi:hypothetical protein